MQASGFVKEEGVVEAEAEEEGKAGEGTGVKAGEKDMLGRRMLSPKEEIR